MYLSVSLAAVVACSSCVSSSNAQGIFHGTSVITTPNYHTHHPANSIWQTSSFYCYFTEAGYVSFGWWLGADPTSIDPSPCKPNPSPNGFDWFEYSTGGCNNSTGQCNFDAVNYSARDAVLPAFEEAYVVVPLQLGPTDRELMFLSYFDKIGGASAVGVRTALEGGKACERAFETLKNLVSKHRLPISFRMENPCRKVEAAPALEEEGQKVLRFDPRLGLAHGFKA